MLGAQIRLAVVGLGYVGLPLALAFGEHRPVLAYDINRKRVSELKAGLDHSLELSAEEIYKAALLHFTSELDDLRGCNCFIIAVPTPINGQHHPDMGPLLAASRAIASILKPGDIVIYESTVYPGATEEECVPVLEQGSGLRFNRDFFCGYSPERINPGDKQHNVRNVSKITSGSTAEVAFVVDRLYREIVSTGTYMAPSMKVAEAAKAIENAQRDINIALINEFAVICNKLGIDTEQVLRAAASKWNFLSFWPGLVGGHCIGVDPYYLAHKARAVGIAPNMILAGRRTNNRMARYVAEQLVLALLRRSIAVTGARVLIMGLTFKEDCADLRNSRVHDIARNLQRRDCRLDLWDPMANADEIERCYGQPPVQEPEAHAYDAIIIAVKHQQFLHLGSKAIHGFGRAKHVLYDLKYVLPADESDLRL